MKMLNLILVSLISICILSGCKNPLSDHTESRIDDNFDNDDAFPSSTFGIFLPLENVNVVNAGNYSVGGVCDPDGGNVVVSMGTPAVVGSFVCYQHGQHNGYFSGVMNLSGITSSALDISISQGSMVASVLPHDRPSVDLVPIASAPTLADQNFVGGIHWVTHIVCSEIGETVIFNGSGLAAGIQTHTCHSSGSPEPITLRFSHGTSTADPNPIVVSSVDANGNPSLATTTFNLPIDNIAPTVAITNGGAVYESEAATFTITVTEDHFTGSYEVTATSGIVNVTNGGGGTTCTSIVCEVEVTAASVGLLIVSVEAAEVEDLAGNTNLFRATSRVNILDDLDPVVLSLDVVSVDADADQWYELGDTVSIEVLFDEPVFVNTATGTPYLSVTLSSGVKSAQYVSGSGTEALIFEFPITASDAQCNGAIQITSMNHNGGTIVDSYNQSPDYSIFPSNLGSVYIDTTPPQAPAVLTLSGTAMNTRTPQLSWTSMHDACGVSQVLWAIGTTAGSDDVQAFMDIGLVNSYQGVNGIGGASFHLTPETDYYVSLKVVDPAGHESVVASSSAWSFTCASPMGSLSRVFDFDSSDTTSIIDSSGASADQPGFMGSVNAWFDLSANMSDMESVDLDLTYSADTNSGALMVKDSYVSGDGTQAMRAYVAPQSGDFVFTFVGQATDLASSEASGLFSSAQNENTLGSWQLDKGGPVSGCEDQFRVHYNDGSAQHSLCGPAFDTKPHLFMIKYDSFYKTMSLWVDNVEYGSSIWAVAPIFDEIRLLDNRNNNGRLPAKIHQVTLLDEILTPLQQESLTEYLSCKWNLSL